ncbi:MAG: hydroxymethylbilane synthase [Planctomycetota bacterium]|nr:hydroxymethylbilane synthase [Planctomycetota bacterium]
MTSSAVLRLGTRNSPLARWQSDWVASQLRERGVDVELIPITTRGDVVSGALGSVGGQGLFTKKIQQALLDGQVDLAVHSLKDLPTDEVPGLALAAVPPRAGMLDAYVSNHWDDLDKLPDGSVVGTGSLRRRTQLLRLRPDLEIRDIRGNVDTRLGKLDGGEFDAILLAEAGLVRLGLEARITQRLSPEIMLPAVGQGALGLETRADDVGVRELLAPIDHAETRAAVTAERQMLAALRGGCLAPVGAWGRVADGILNLDGVVLNRDGQERVFASHTASLEEAVGLGQRVADNLLSQGAADLISSVRSRASNRDSAEES